MSNQIDEGMLLCVCDLGVRRDYYGGHHRAPGFGVPSAAGRNAGWDIL